jgi:FdhE protein
VTDCIDNDVVTRPPWRERIERAEELASTHEFAAEVLRFYVRIANFQQELHRRIQSSSTKLTTGTAPAELSYVLASFPAFLLLLAEHAPETLRRFAAAQLESGSAAHGDILNTFWMDGAGLNDLEEFCARAFLQPYAEFVRSSTDLRWPEYNQCPCPFCGRKPAFGVLRQQGDGGSRSLVCSFCMAEWQFRRILCAGCGEEDHKKLPVFTADGLTHVRVECCDTCQSYLKTVDLTRNGLAVPVVDEIAAIPLDLWVQDRGYHKLQVNLMQA